MAKKPKSPIKPDTRLVTAGRDPQANHGFVNPPVYHASTVLYPTADDQVAHRARYSYGRRGTPTSEALEDALRELDGDGCAGVALLPSGLAAISAALLSVARAGDHDARALDRITQTRASVESLQWRRQLAVRREDGSLRRRR